MRAFVVNQYKGPLREADVPGLAVGEHDVLVRVQAAGLNLLDEKIRAGEFKQILPYTLPLILGNDIAGTVIRVGAKVGGFKRGDEVYARPDKDRIGTFAERIAVAEADLALKPASISIQEAGSLPLVALTAWQASSPNTSVRPSPPRRAVPTRASCANSAPTPSSTTAARTSNSSSTATTWCWTASAEPTSRSLCAC